MPKNSELLAGDEAYSLYRQLATVNKVNQAKRCLILAAQKGVLNAKLQFVSSYSTSSDLKDVNLLGKLFSELLVTNELEDADDKGDVLKSYAEFILAIESDRSRYLYYLEESAITGNQAAVVELFNEFKNHSNKDLRIFWSGVVGCSFNRESIIAVQAMSILKSENLVGRNVNGVSINTRIQKFCSSENDFERRYWLQSISRVSGEEKGLGIDAD